MKKTILNLYQRDYFTFYLVVFLLDTISLVLTKIPVLTIAIMFIVMTLLITQLLSKFKK